MSGLALWSDVDTYIEEKLHAPDPELSATLAASEAAGLPSIAVSPAQGKFLHLLARIRGARRILEIGTLGGYSTTWLARALPADGKLITLEFEPKHFETAHANLERSGLSHLVEQRLGPALESLQQLGAEGVAPFDLIFIDADKPNNPNYLAWALKLSRPGTVILCDNVIREGEVLDPGSDDPRVLGTRQLFDALSGLDTLDATALQTVGSKGYDGFIVAVVR